MIKETDPAPGRRLPTPFDLYGPLPTGTTVLEASAGTGKTYTIAALATRYIADGVADLAQLMMVTFGRMATNELRLRVRERLAHSERFLALTAGQRSAAGPDQLDRLLADGSDDEVALRRRRLRAALADFDAATIATTHEFCQTMLAGLGVLGDHDEDASFAESLTDLTHEVAADCYLQRFANLEVAPPFSFEEALKIADQVVRNASSRLVPELDPARSVAAGVAVPGAAPSPIAHSPAAQRIGFGRDVRTELERRKARLRLYSYDDMLTGLRDRLADPESGERAAERLRARYRVVLVDEFQDTDPVQWEILRRAFDGHTTLILIGDPKQAIYAFRGADVFSYLAAVAGADTVATLDTNWRSDAGLVEAQQVIMGGAALGDPRIVVRDVRSAHPEPRLRLPAGSGDQNRGPHDPGHQDPGHQDPGHQGLGRSNPMLAPVRVRVRQVDPTERGFPQVKQWRPELAADLARDVVALLASGAELRSAGAARSRPAGTEATTRQGVDPASETSTEWRPVGPGDIAVLVRNNARLETVKAALDAAGVPAVVRGARSVFCSEAALEWRRLLVACEQPRQGLIREVARTTFVGWGLAGLVAADDEALTRLAAMVRRWARILGAQGVAALLEAITEETGLAQRLLGAEDGERRLTDLRHVGQSLHAAQTAAQLGVGGLLAWLTERIADAERSQSDELSRRLETDAAAVQILTIHRSKGLEFPVVYLPEAWDRWVPDDDGQVLHLHAAPEESTGDRAGDGDDAEDLQDVGQPPAEVLDIGGALGPGRRDRLAQARDEEAGEDLRIYYVALTRASSQVVTWWLPSANTARSALQRFLFRARSDGATPQPFYEVKADPGGLPQLDPRLFSIEPMTAEPPAHWHHPDASDGELGVRRFDRDLDLSWRRTSYSSLTAPAHGLAPTGTATGSGPSSGSGSGVGSEPEIAREDDETAATDLLGDLPWSGPGTAVPGGGSAQSMISPMSDLPMGAQFGTVVHALLEEIDPRADDLVAALTGLAAAELTRGPAGPMTAAQLGSGLAPALQTPLGPLAGDVRLADLPVADRLSELTFELPLAGGDDPSAEIRLGDLVPVLQRHLGPADPLHTYPDLLTLPVLAEQPLRGYLNGSIDAVLRIRDRQLRYLVVDYKTNWLGDPDVRPLPIGNYTPELMATAMMQAHYPLQALLYSVALHRYLRWRQPGYAPDLHLGGVLYLFLRGMAGPDTPRVDGVPYGVFSWRPPSALIVELSDLLDGRR